MAEDSFAERLAAATPTPGGGAAAARVGLYAASLLRMVTGITLEKLARRPPQVNVSAELLAAARKAEELSESFKSLEEEDIQAFQAYLDALRIPCSSPEEVERRRTARLAAAARATDVPLAMLETARDVLHLAGKLLEIAGRTPLTAESDLGAAVELASAAFRVAEWNVRVNLPVLSPQKASEVREKLKELEETTMPLHSRLRAVLLERMKEG